MRLRGWLSQEDFAKLPADQQAYYEEQAGIMVLKEGETEDVTALKNAHERQKQDNTTLKNKFKDVDPDKYAQLVQEEENLKTQQLAVQQQIDANNVSWQQKLDRETGALKTRSQQLYTIVEKQFIDNELLKAGGDKILSPNIWLRAAKDFVKLKEIKTADGGIDFQVEVIDDKKLPRFSSKDPSKPMNLTELVEDLGTKDEFKPLYKAAVSAGSGDSSSKTTNSTEGNPLVISREDAADMSKYRALREQAATEGRQIQIAQQ